jgi:hypothetical protein
MNSHVAIADPVTHEKVQRLLPWLLAGTLDGTDLALVQPHLESCAQCQADLAWQRKLCAAAPLSATACDPDRAFAQLLPRLGPQGPRVDVLERWRRAGAANSAWLRWVALAELAAIGVLSLMLAQAGAGTGAGEYRAMGAGAQTQGNLVVMFNPDTSEREIRRILQASGARMADGPTVTDAYVLALPAAQAGAALARLRAEPAVTLAQPLAAESRP